MIRTGKYREAVAYVESFSNTSIRNSPTNYIERTRYFLNLLGNPDKGFNFIHVTGTAGKGTVSAMLQKILVASGRTTGLFASPHVTTTIERIRVNDRYIAPDEFVKLVEYIKPLVTKVTKSTYGGPSVFELYFIIAILYFKMQKCRWVVLEVGVGGRYDATNVILSPKITVITNIDYDHTKILGKTLKKIATDKMGIIKKGSVFFTSEQRPVLQKMFKKQCGKVGAFYRSVDKQDFYSDYNLELVRSIAHELNISRGYIDKGIAATHLPCRFEIVQTNPTVVLDGAHNRVKIKSTIANLSRLNFKKIYLILALADNHRDHLAILRPLLSLNYPLNITLTQVKGRERMTIYSKQLLSLVKQFKKKNDIVRVIEDADQALDLNLDMAHKDDLLLVTGSFFLAGELRKRWVSEDWILKSQSSYKK